MSAINPVANADCAHVVILMSVALLPAGSHVVENGTLQLKLVALVVLMGFSGDIGTMVDENDTVAGSNQPI